MRHNTKHEISTYITQFHTVKKTNDSTKQAMAALIMWR